MSGNYRPTERQSGIGNWSASAPSGDAGNATHPCDGARGIVYECVAATASPAGTVEGKTAGGVWTQIKSYQLTSGTLTARAAGATITLATGDLLYVPSGGFTHVRFKRASGTSMTWTARTLEDLADILTVLGAGGSTVLEALADDGTFTVGTSKVFPNGFLADETASDSVDEGDIGAGRMTLDRQIRTVLGVTTAGGATFYKTIDLDESEEEVKATAGQFYGYLFYNAAATAHYLKLFNATAANVSVGTTVPDITLPLPPGVLTGFMFPNGVPFSTAITIAATTGVADNDTGAPAANAVIGMVLYK